MKAKKFPDQENYAAKMKNQGFVRVGVWIPPSGRDELCEIAEEMRKEHLQDAKSHTSVDGFSD